MRIGLDVDGVLANFYLAMCRRECMPYEVITKWNLDWIWKAYPEVSNDEDFWSNIPTLSPPDSILFQPAAYVSALPSKMAMARKRWLKENGYPDAPLYVTGNKAWAYETLDLDLFVDDKPSTIADMTSKGMNVLQFVPDYFITDQEPHHIRHLSQIPYNDQTVR